MHVDSTTTAEASAPAAVPTLQDRLDAVAASALGAAPIATFQIATGLSLCEDLLALRQVDRASYEALIAARRPLLGVWLWRLALAVAAAGWPSAGLELLDALPGVLVDGACREVVAAAFREPAGTPLRAVGGGR